MQISNWLQSIRKLHIYNSFVRTLMFVRSLVKRLVPKKRSIPCSPLTRFEDVFFNLRLFPCHLEEKKDIENETNFEQCNLNLTADQYLLHEEGAFISASVLFTI